MEKRWILPVPEYYARINAYVMECGLPWSIGSPEIWEEEAARFGEVMGPAGGRSVLDCSCGWGRQTIALAKLGWQVTACDVSETSIEIARGFAEQHCLEVDFRALDMRHLSQAFQAQFDWVVSCFGLYEIPTEAGMRQAILSIHAALKPGGRLYLRLADMDQLMEEQPRHTFHGEARTSTGRVIAIHDWDYESDDQVVAIDAFLREDERLDPEDDFRWTTETVGCRKFVLRKAGLERMLREASFDPVAFLPRPAVYYPFEVVAEKRHG